MARRVLNLVALVSLVLLFLAVAWLVRPRGNRTDTYFRRAADGRYLLVNVYPGKVAFGRSTRTAINTDWPPLPVGITWGHESGTAGAGPRRSRAGTA